MEPTAAANAVSNVKNIDPAFVNLDYVFYQIFRIIRGFIAFILSFLGIKIDPNSYFGKLLNATDAYGGQSAAQIGATWMSWFKFIASVLAVIAIAIIIYCLVRLWEIRKEDKEKEKEMQVRILEEETYSHSLKWQNVIEHANSDSSSDWRLAIMEADTMLEQASQRFPGETLGERLRKLDKNSFRTLDSAWEAHKVRNRIAHDGLDFEITKRETLRVINMFEEALRELGGL